MMKAVISPRACLRLLVLASLGGALEMYDFALFANYAPILGHVFFPSERSWLSLFAAMVVFAVGYLIRPLGGMVMGHLGDRYGRKTIFLLSIVLMAAATFFLAVLPTYAKWGATASLLFLVLRLCQGVALGAEIPGAMTFICEHLPERKVLATGMLFGISFLGMVLASYVFIAFNAWWGLSGWRYAFLLGSLLAVVGFLLRRQLLESPAFLANKQRERIPMLTLLRHDKRAILAGFLMAGFLAAMISLMYLFMHAYLTLQHYPKHAIGVMTAFGLSCFAIASVVWGVMVKQDAHRWMLVLSIVATLLSAAFFIEAVLHHHGVMLAYACFAVVSASYVGLVGAKLVSLFSVSVRFSGVALCFNLAFAIFAGLAPIMALLLIHWTRQPVMLLVLFVGVGVLSLLGVWFQRSEKIISA